MITNEYLSWYRTLGEIYNRKNTEIRILKHVNSELYQFPTMGIGVFYNVSYHTGGILVQYIMLTNVTNYYYMTFSIENRNQMAIQLFVFLLAPQAVQ